MDGWDDRYLAQCQFCFYKVFSENWRKVPDEVLGGYCHGMMDLQNTWRVLPK
jgi:hypothetical protein